ncbi:GDSL-type esterase/lipase family protein [Synechococcus elongatus]|uniref:GDSL-type esterase/lipase family protein n=1 Tax=Synechococcus elongatus TaxID=32046 RepID=UPI000F7EF929|nr:GDSL-type esterase/lipase family protein [Synechococcus elongatus]
MGSTVRPLVPQRWIAIGDSTIYGYGDPEGGGWVERLRRQWMHPDRPGPVLYNLGVRGDGVEQVQQRLEAEFRCRGELRRQQPDVILLSVGINDSARIGSLKGRQMCPRDRFTEAIQALLQESKSLAPTLVIGMVPVSEAQMPFADCLWFNHADQHEYTAITQQACEELNLPYLDLFSRWWERGEEWWQSCLGPDGLHPNVSGYRAIYEEVQAWAPLQQLLYQPSLAAEIASVRTRVTHL